ncbi:NAD-binding protein [uncultured Methanobrevibacter sp.]|uniref:NAD-binding protein n=1 Tax=uncultured Methanobrevibacter sp. TaxID=253161 RepID=UPI0026076209
MKTLEMLLNYIREDKANIYGSLIIIFIISYGIIGSIYIMHLNIFDSIYYTFITIATVGYGDIIPLTPLQKLFTVSLAISGLGIIAYILTVIISSVTENLHDLRSDRIMERKLSDIENHYVLCGYGRVGSAVFEEIKKRNQKVIIVDNDERKTEDIEEDDGVIVLNADATEDKTLKKLNIEKSLGVIIATGNDVDNLYIVLTTREMYNDAHIICRASKKENIKRFERAGADKIISPEASGGSEMYFAAAKPNLVHITERHDVDMIEREMNIIRKYNCHIEDIEYHFHGLKMPVSRKIGVMDIEEEEKFFKRINEDSAVKESLENIYNTVNGVHSHWLSGPDRKHLKKAIEELKREGIVLGINLEFEEINEFTKKYKEQN